MELVFSTFVFGSYQKYIPYYIYSIWKTYPNSFIKVFVEDQLNNNVIEVLYYFKKKNIQNFDIVNWDSKNEDFEGYSIKGGAKKLIRWTLGYNNFKDFEYAYIGDVDILFLSEKDSILDLHKAQMKSLNLPFSNKVRLDVNENTTERLTGLHFLKTKEYFEKINPIISHIKEDKTYRDGYLEGLKRDENFLYKINKEAFNFNPELVSTAQRPWHGLHLGITRGNKNLDIQTIEENSSLNLEEVKKQIKLYLQDPIFRRIQSKVFLIELEVILKELSIPYSISWKFKGFQYRINQKWLSIKKRIKKYLK